MKIFVHSVSQLDSYVIEEGRHGDLFSPHFSCCSAYSIPSTSHTKTKLAAS